MAYTPAPRRATASPSRVWMDHCRAHPGGGVRRMQVGPLRPQWGGGTPGWRCM